MIDLNLRGKLARLCLLLLGVLMTASWLGGCGSAQVKEGDAPDLILEKARRAIEQGRYGQAIDRYRRLESLYPYNRQALQAQIMTAYAYYRKGEAVPAVQAAERFIQLHPRHPRVDYARYLKGLAHYSQIGEPDRDPENARKAVEAFGQLLRQHPNSPYAEDALKRMHRANQLLAQHELHVARFYLDRQAYVAMVNRCHRILTRHSHSEAVEPALALMARGYARLGLEVLHRETLAILKRNYPNSPWLSKAREEVTKPGETQAKGKPGLPARGRGAA